MKWALNRGWLLGGVSGLLLVFCLEPYRYWPLALFVFAPLAITCMKGNWGVVVAAGIGHGVVASAGCLYYVLPALHREAAVSWIAAVSLWILLAITQSLRALGAVLLGKLLMQRSLGPILVLPAAWVIAEWAIPAVFPCPLGLVAVGLPEWLQLAAVGGPLLVTWWVATVGACLGAAFMRWRESRALAVRSLILGGLTVGAVTVLGVTLLRETDEEVRRLPIVRLAVVQGAHLPQSMTDQRDTLRRYRDESLELVSKSGAIDLVVWPESLQLGAIAEGKLESYLRNYVRTDRREGAASRVLSAPVLLGLNVRRGEDSSYLTNSIILLNEAGKVTDWYDKQVLMPLGEAPIAVGLPFTEPWELLPPVTRYRAGTSDQALRLGDHQITVVSCYEDLLHEQVRRLVSRGGGNLLISTSSDAWFDGAHARQLHSMLASLRAIEQRRYLLRATRDGLTALFAPTGEQVWSLPTGMLAKGVVSARWMSRPSTYCKYGDIPIVVVAVLSALLPWLLQALGLLSRRQNQPKRTSLA